MSLPSISVIFLSYKQEAYVVAALRAVLEQDLPDYEIIIGDDASPDRTRALIEAELAAYRGRARIVLLPPAPNVGVIRNFNRCVAASTGDILVAAAGDDVSHPTRLRRIAEFFRDHPECYAHYSNARVVDAVGGVLRPTWYHHQDVQFRQFDPRGFHLYQGVQFCGATGSYRGDVFRKFPPMPGTTGGEDGPAILRSLLLGSAAIDAEILLDWRWHGANMSHGSKPHWPPLARQAPSRRRLARRPEGPSPRLPRRPRPRRTRRPRSAGSHRALPPARR
jgi:glycosyltransferase involved in cell wall biosynthesis